jgi:trk system potassium uptake protein TrkH
VGGRQLLESELPGPEVERLTARIRDTARRLWVLYVGLTALLALALASIGWAGADDRMDLFQAVAHAFTTMPTGGFSTEPRSIEVFSAATQWTIAAFMIIAGANFALLYRVVRKRGNPGRDEEFRLYLFLLALAVLALAVELDVRGLYGGEEAVRSAVFQAASIMTTTGFASADFNLWPTFAAMVLVALMFVGGSAGSTAGGIKVIRHLILVRLLRRELDQAVHREAVVPIRLNRLALDESAVRGVASFVLLYVTVFVAGTAGLVVCEAVSRAGPDLSWSEAISAAATTLANVGPGLGFLGPMGSFDSFSSGSKTILIVLMWMGRLEIVPIAVLLTRRYWRA